MLHRAPCVCCKCVCKRCLYVAPNIFFFHFGYAIFNGNILILPLLFHFIHGNSFVFALKMSDLSDSDHCISNVIALMRFVVDSREPHWFTLCVTIGKKCSELFMQSENRVQMSNLRLFVVDNFTLNAFSHALSFGLIQFCWKFQITTSNATS